MAIRRCEMKKAIEMRVNALCLIGAVAVLAIPLSAGAAPAQADRQAAVSAEQARLAAFPCPPGYYWEPAAYAPHGKFRLAHCAARW
jgi:hypothetical protein